ncbi:MAG: hypothetical protein AAF685_11455 [Cyanobacteria bacterium P01_C01_bin.89]
METQPLKTKIEAVLAQRDWLLNLLETPDLGALRLDVNQALEELDDLQDEYDATFPGTGESQTIAIN